MISYFIQKVEETLNMFYIYILHIHTVFGIHEYDFLAEHFDYEFLHFNSYCVVLHKTATRYRITFFVCYFNIDLKKKEIYMQIQLKLACILLIQVSGD